MAPFLRTVQLRTNEVGGGGSDRRVDLRLSSACDRPGRVAAAGSFDGSPSVCAVAYPDLAPVRPEVSAEQDVAPVLDVVVPVYNEEVDLERCVSQLHAHLRSNLPYSFRITVADNASTDTTLALANRLADEYEHVRV